VILELFQWGQDTAVAGVIRDSIWAFAVIQAIHLLGLALLGGAILVVDLRLMGFGLKGQRIADLIRHARPWAILAIGLLITTGVLMALPAGAVRYYFNTSFWVKMITLPVALIFSLAVRDRIGSNPSLDTTLMTRALGFASLTLWFTVAAAGCWIGFS
jgi:hypothetical protein